MRRALIALLLGLAAASAQAFDLQGHRGARGLAPENTLEGFALALSIGVTTLELDLAMTRDNVLVVSHDRRLNPDHTRGPDGKFLDAEGPPIRTLTLAELQTYDVGRLKPGSAYAAALPEQRPADGARIPTLAALFGEVARAGADHVRFNIETKITPTSGAETPDPDTFAMAVATAIRVTCWPATRCRRRRSPAGRSDAPPESRRRPSSSTRSGSKASSASTPPSRGPSCRCAPANPSTRPGSIAT